MIAEEFERLGIAPQDISLKVGILPSRGARACATKSRKTRHRRHRHLRPDRSHGPPAWPVSASKLDGPVIWGTPLYPEIIDPNTGEVLPDGSEGELVFTLLTKEAFR